MQKKKIIVSCGCNLKSKKKKKKKKKKRKEKKGSFVRNVQPWSQVVLSEMYNYHMKKKYRSIVSLEL